MIKTEAIVIKKYAEAFLNVFEKKLTLAQCDALQALADALDENKNYAVFLILSTIKPEEKLLLLKKIWDQYAIPQEYSTLIDLLLHDKRILFLSPVLRNIIIQYKERARIATFTIASAQPLSESDLSIIKQFLARHTGCAITYTYAVDKNLIAGLRLQSDTVLWEHSLEKQLRTIGLSLMH